MAVPTFDQLRAGHARSAYALAQMLLRAHAAGRTCMADGTAFLTVEASITRYRQLATASDAEIAQHNRDTSHAIDARLAQLRGRS